MKVIGQGHHYFLSNKNFGGQEIKFVQENGEDGVIVQEVLRCLIDRLVFLDRELPHNYNKSVINNLRHALVLMECRHLLRLVEKGLPVENIDANPHFVLTSSALAQKSNNVK